MKVVNAIEDKDRKRINKTKNGFAYGYNNEYDFVVISKDGKIGEVVEIQGLRIALPEVPDNVHSRSEDIKEQYWEALDSPNEEVLKKINSIQEFSLLPEKIKDPWYDYINQEFERRDEGFWYMNNGVPTYVTGTHYMYLQWTKIDVDAVDFREPNRIFFIFWEACKADQRCYGMCYLKNRRSGFSFMAAAETVNQATQNKNSRYGILSKTGEDAKKLFTGKVVPMSGKYPFFFRPIQDGMEKPKTELLYQVPSKRITLKSWTETSIEEDGLVGLDTSIDWKATGDYSYDGEKLKLLVHDESGKWVRPDNILNNWGVTKTCLRLGRRIVGKCMMGSTSGALDKGGDNFKSMYNDSDLTQVQRNKNGQTATGLYALFIPMEWNFEGFFDRYGYPVFETPEEPVMGNDGELITEGVIEYWENEVDGYKHNADKLNEHYRQYPRTEKHAFRDEIENSLFNLTKIYDQIDHNETLFNQSPVTTGRFMWKGGVRDTEVEFVPDRHGRFRVTWIPPYQVQNNVIEKNGNKLPGNMDMGAFGCDSYDISGTVGGGGSNGALHGMTGFSMMSDVPSGHFFLEYVARPPQAEIFFEDVLMACVFYGMPILVENNKPGLLYHFKRRGYRGFSLNRPDKLKSKLSVAEIELGGIPNTSEFVKQAHAAAIESYIEECVGINENGQMGDMFFQRTLEDWSRFDITKRTKYDASISSGLALMAVKRQSYYPRQKRTVEPVSMGFKSYNQHGNHSRIIR